MDYQISGAKERAQRQGEHIVIFEEDPSLFHSLFSEDLTGI